MPPLQESMTSARPPLPTDNRSAALQGRPTKAAASSADSVLTSSVKQAANVVQMGQQAGEGTVEGLNGANGVAQKSEFEMVDVTITVLGMTGIVSESLRSRSSSTGKSSRSPVKDGSSVTGSKSKSKKVASEKSTASSHSSGDAASVPNSLSDNGIPVTAVMSFYRNVTNSQTTIATHVPSLPLGTPTSAFGNSSRFTAIWAGHDTDIANGDEPSEQASFKFSRLLKRERKTAAMDGAASNETKRDDRPVFSPEIQEFRVGLGRGNQLVPLGVASIVVTGSEDGIAQVNLPIKSGREGILRAESLNNSSASPGKKRKAPTFAFRKTSPKKNGMRGSAVSFQGDPRRIFMLDETATLRLLVRTTFRAKTPPPMQFSPDELDGTLQSDSSVRSRSTGIAASSSLGATTREDVVSALSYSIAVCDDEERFAGDTDDNCYYGDRTTTTAGGDRTTVGSIELSQEYREYDFDPDEVHYVMGNDTMHFSAADTDDHRQTPQPYGSSFFSCGRMCTVMETSQPYPGEYEDTSVYSAEAGEEEFESASEPPSQVFAPKVMGATVKHVRRRSRSRSPDSETQDSVMSDSQMDEDEEFYADDEREFRPVDSGTVTTLTQSIDGTNLSANNMKDIKKARDMIHRYANRIGVNPEDLV